VSTITSSRGTAIKKRVPSTFHTYTAAAAPEGGRGILMHPTEPNWLEVNETARQIVQWVFDDGLTAAEAADRLADHYGIPVDVARQDTDRVLGAMKAAGMLERLNGEPGPGPRLKALFMFLTKRCNLHCVHCYRGEAEASDMPLDVAKRILDQLVEGGGTSVTFSGGEALQHPRIKEILQHVGRRLKVAIGTNGTLITAEWAAFFARELEVIVQISLDGPDAETHDPIRGKGSFARSMEGIRHLKEAGLGNRIVLSATIMNQNIQMLRGMAVLAARLQVPTVRFLVLRDQGRASETWTVTGEALRTRDNERVFEDFLEDPKAVPPGVEVRCGLSGFNLEPSRGSLEKKHWCDVGRMLAVDVDGSAYPCTLMMDGEFNLGSVHAHSLQELHATGLMGELVGALSQRQEKAPGCADCTWKTFCQSGCMALAHKDKGTIWAKDPFCGYRKKIYARGFDRILKGVRPAAPPSSCIED